MFCPNNQSHDSFFRCPCSCVGEVALVEEVYDAILLEALVAKALVVAADEVVEVARSIAQEWRIKA